jgi:hypothetical protein
MRICRACRPALEAKTTVPKIASRKARPTATVRRQDSPTIQYSRFGWRNPLATIDSNIRSPNPLFLSRLTPDAAQLPNPAVLASKWEHSLSLMTHIFRPHQPPHRQSARQRIPNEPVKSLKTIKSCGFVPSFPYSTTSAPRSRPAQPRHFAFFLVHHNGPMNPITCTTLNLRPKYLWIFATTGSYNMV